MIHDFMDINDGDINDINHHTLLLMIYNYY